MQRVYGGVLLLVAGLWGTGLGEARASAIVNGDFATGDLTGWTVSAIDEFVNPIDPSPFINVTTLNGNNVAQFKTGEFDDGLFIATLEQAFTVTAAEPFLSFDFTLPVVSPDPTGTGTSPFLDSFFVSLASATDFFDLLLVDQFGALPDPFGTAPGVVTLGVPLDPAFDFTFNADLSSLAGETITLFLDVLNEDDGFQFDLFYDNAALLATPRERPMPEPNSLWLLGIGLIGLLGRVRRKLKEG